MKRLMSRSKKQLNRMVEVIKVIDFYRSICCYAGADVYQGQKTVHRKIRQSIFQIAQTYQAKVRDYGKDSVLLEFVHTAHKKYSDHPAFYVLKFNSIEVVRGGSVGIEAITMPKR